MWVPLPEHSPADLIRALDEATDLVAAHEGNGQLQGGTHGSSNNKDIGVPSARCREQKVVRHTPLDDERAPLPTNTTQVLAPSISYLVVEVVLAEPDGVVLLVQLLAPERHHGGVVVVLGVGVRLHRNVTQPSSRNIASETWEQKTMIRELGMGEVGRGRERS